MSKVSNSWAVSAREKAKPKNYPMQTSSYLKGIGILLLTFGVILGIIVLVWRGIVEAEACLGFLVSGTIVLLLSFYAKQVGEENLGLWGVRSTLSRKMRRIVGSFLIVWAFAFYFPLIPGGLGAFPYVSAFGSPLFTSLSTTYPSLFSGWTGTALNFLSGYSIGPLLTIIPFVAAGLIGMLPEVQMILPSARGL
jgi:hypothetical protein